MSNNFSGYGGLTTLSKNKNAFLEWVQTLGVEQVAHRLKTHPSTVSNWLKLRCEPRVIQIKEIKRITKGRVSYDDIIDRPLAPDFRRKTKS